MKNESTTDSQRTYGGPAMGLGGLSERWCTRVSWRRWCRFPGVGAHPLIGTPAPQLIKQGVCVQVALSSAE